MAKPDTKIIRERLATSFVIDIVEEAMKRFSITYEELDKVLRKMNYWEVFNDSEVTAVGAHDGIEPVLDEIEKELRKNR